MQSFIVITLLFLDFNMNNIFDDTDKIIQINNNKNFNQNVYCQISNTKDANVCGYSSTNSKDFLLDDDLLKTLKGVHYTFNTEVFEKGYKSGRVLYIEVIDGKYLYVTDENKLNTKNEIYSLSNNDGIYLFDFYQKLIYGVIILLVVLGLWIFLFPKKNNN